MFQLSFYLIKSTVSNFPKNMGGYKYLTIDELLIVYFITLYLSSYFIMWLLGVLLFLVGLHVFHPTNWDSIELLTTKEMSRFLQSSRHFTTNLYPIFIWEPSLQFYRGTTLFPCINISSWILWIQWQKLYHQYIYLLWYQMHTMSLSFIVFF